MATNRFLVRAAMEGVLSGIAMLSVAAGCSAKQSTSVTAPMEAASAPSATSPTTANANTLPKIQPIAIARDPQPKDCCKGKNDCKGTTGCRSEGSLASCARQHDCKGKNECKGLGTSCDFADDENGQPITPLPSSSRSRNTNCCSGKNECKGKSGCKTSSNPYGAGGNECRGKGTSCPKRR